MALYDEGPQVEPVNKRTGTRVPTLLVLGGIAFIVVALIKPWGIGLDTGTARPPGQPSSSPQPTTSPGLIGPWAAHDAVGLYPQCYESSAWRVAAIQTTNRMTVRTVWPVAATVDPIVPLKDPPRLFGQPVQGIGFCAPGNDSATRAGLVGAVTVWRRDASGRLLQVLGTRIIDSQLANEGEVYLAPPAFLEVSGGWPEGDYFFKVQSGRLTSVWIALQLLPSPSPQTGTPSAAPNAASSAVPGAVPAVPLATPAGPTFWPTPAG